MGAAAVTAHSVVVGWITRYRRASTASETLLQVAKQPQQTDHEADHKKLAETDHAHGRLACITAYYSQSAAPAQIPLFASATIAASKRQFIHH